MNAVIYVRDSGGIPIYSQYNKCADYANRQGYSIVGKVLDFESNKFHEAVNMTISKAETVALLIYSRESAFDDFEEYLFFKIYLEKLGKQLVSCN